VPAGAEELHTFFKDQYPHLVASKTFGNRHRAIKIWGGYVSAADLKQLLAELALTDGQNEQGAALAQQLLHTSVARRYWRSAEQVAVAAATGSGAAAAGVGSDSDDDEGNAAGRSPLSAPALSGWPGSSTAAAVVPDELVASVAAALAAARQLVSCCGSAVDGRELQAAQLQLEDVLAAAGTELRAGIDYNEQVTPQ
jgi:hypothetical protein